MKTNNHNIKMDSSSKDNSVISYVPIRNQASQIATSLIIFLIFGAVQWIRLEQPAQLGIIDYWRFSLLEIPNDYKLIVLTSAFLLPWMLIVIFSTIIDKNKVNPLLLGLLNPISTIINFIIMTFFFYLIFYRGLWSLSEFRNGFSFIPILKMIFFVGVGTFGFKAFSHFYQLKRLVRQNKMEAFIDYVVKYKLNKI